MGNLTDVDIVIALVETIIESGRTDEELLEVTDIGGDAIQLLSCEILCGDIDIALVLAIALFPIDLSVWRIGEAVDLGDRRSEHGRVVFLGENGVAVLVFLDEGGGEFVEFVSAAALPVDVFGDAIVVSVVNYTF